MSFDYSKLLGKITEVYGTQYNFAKALEVSERTLSLKLNNKRAWTQTEMSKCIKLLNIPEKNIPQYFFASKVQFC
ncbi:MAG: DUF739 family protein [Liquorilactobacillus ghanensis]|uniref:DUF739 family protein n=1 Tax=Liquorilactobacillus ghanensis TaxID=399370 RepID=UPI0039EA0A41